MANTLGNYSDIQGLTGLRAKARQDPASALKTVAREFESQFIQMMLASMREASEGDPLFDNSQTKMFRELFDKEVSQKLAAGPGIGLAQVIERQLERHVSGADEAGAREPRFYDLPQRRAELRPINPVVGDTSADQVQEQSGDTLTGPAVASRLMPFERRQPSFSLDDIREVAALAETAPSSSRPARPLQQQDAIRWETPEQFAEALMPHARRAAERLGVDPQVLVAQSALETGWGRHIPKDAAGRENMNLFGIKADPSWRGPKTRVSTLEFENGVMVRQQASFRQYDSIEAAFDDYVRFLEQNPRYQEALEVASRGDSRQFVRELQNAGYATDPDYADKILSILASGRIPSVSPSDLTEHREGKPV